MARSRCHTQISGRTTAPSDARWKASAARKLRRRVRQTLTAEQELTRFAGKRWDLVNLWSSEKDGKGWVRNPAPEFWRK
ncbi:MAG: hypothetical protein NTX28_17985 [Novosphingobium sp.]|nr:hypothetical protein [Novosphingobium sp.]